MSKCKDHNILKYITIKSFHIMHFNTIKTYDSNVKFCVSERPEHLGVLLKFLIPNNIFCTANKPENSTSDICPNKGGKLTKFYITGQ